MKIMLNIAAVFACVTVGSQAMAATSTYHCTISNQSNRGFIPPDMRISLDTRAGTAQVYDGIIHNMLGKPMTVDAQLVSSQKYRMKYSVQAPTSNSGKMKLTYTLRFDQGRQTYSLTGILHGADNTIRGQGTCKPIT